MTNNNSNIPTEEEVLKEIEEYNNRRSGPRLDTENTIKGLERFYKEVLHEKTWEAPHHTTTDIKLVGLNEGDIIEN